MKNHNKLKRMIMEKIKIEQINYQLAKFKNENYDQKLFTQIELQQIKQVFIEMQNERSKHKKKHKKTQFKTEERRKLQLDEMKKEMSVKEQLLNEEEERKDKMIDILRKRDEFKQQEQVDKFKIHITEKQKVAEDIERNKQRLLDDRAKALDYWIIEDHSQTQNTWNVANKINPKLFQTEKAKKTIFDNKHIESLKFPETNPFKANRYSHGILTTLKQNIKHKEQIEYSSNLNVEGVRNLLIGSKQASLNSSYSAQAIKYASTNVSSNIGQQSNILSLLFLDQETQQKGRSKKEKATESK